MKTIVIIASMLILASCSDMATRESSSGTTVSGATASGTTYYGSMQPNTVRSEDPMSMPATGP